MANPTGGFGLRPVRRLDGAALTFQLEEVQIAFNNGSVIAQGDLIKPLNTGFIDLYANGGAITQGVFHGCKYRDPNLGYTVWRPIWNAVSGLSSSDKVFAYIYSDPQIVYEVRGDASNAIVQTHIGNTADVTVGSPNARDGQSVAVLATGGLGTTATFPLRVVALGTLIGNDNTLVNNIVEVVLSSMLSATGGGVAI